MKDRDGNEFVFVPRSTLEHILEYWNGNQNERAMADALEHILETVQEAIDAAPQFVAGEFTDEVAARVLTHFSNFPVRLTNAQNGHDMIAAVRSELGPALGLETQRHRDNEIDALEQKLARADARIAELEAALRGALDFVERHSNRWDGERGKHPMSIVTAARKALAP